MPCLCAIDTVRSSAWCRYQVHSVSSASIPLRPTPAAPSAAHSAIIDSLRRYIGRRYHFLLAENNIQVITGREEGIYQWIAINFALGR